MSGRSAHTALPIYAYSIEQGKFVGSAHQSCIVIIIFKCPRAIGDYHGASAAASGNGTNAGAIPDATSLTGTGKRRLGGSMPRSRNQRRTKLALTPLARAIPATEAPGSQQASTTACLNASGVMPPPANWFLYFH